MIEAVIFDMDGVLIDSEPIYDTIALELLAERGHRPPDELFDQLRGLTSDQVWAKIAAAIELPSIAEELATECTHRLEQFFTTSPDLSAIDGIPELVRALQAHGLRLAVASSSVRDRVEIILDRLQLRAFMDAVLTGDDVTASKPDPEIFVAAAARMGLRPERCAVIEDSHNGLLAARAAGMAVVAYAPDVSLILSAPHDLLIRSFTELSPERLQRLTQAQTKSATPPSTS